MKHLFTPFCLGLLGLVMAAGHPAQSQVFTAAKLMPAALPVASSPMAVTVVADGSGNTYVTGGFRGTIQFGATTLTSAPNVYNLPSLDVYVAKMDPQGNYLWAVRAGSAEDDESIDLARTPTGTLYLLGSVWNAATVGPSVLPARTPFVARLDEQQGNIAWAVPVGNITCTKIAADAAGNVLLTGYSQNAAITVAGTTFNNPGTTPLPPYYYVSPSVDGFVAKLSPAGTWLWVRQMAGPAPTDYVPCRGVAVDAQGNTYVTGNLQTRADFGPITLTSTPGTSRAFVAKLDPAGNWLWAVAPDSPPAPAYPGSTIGKRLAVSSTGDVYWVGSLEVLGAAVLFGSSTLSSTTGGYGNLFLAKLSSQGQFQWAVQSTGTGSEFAVALALDPAGNAYLAGAYSGFPITFGPTVLPNAGMQDLFVTKVNAAGVYQWAVGAGGSSFDSGFSIAADDQGMAYVTGTTTSPVSSFGNINLGPSATAGYGFWARVATGAVTATVGANALGASLQLAPNPCRDAVSISGPEPGQAVRLHDALGREVLAATMPTAGPLRLALPPTLRAGIYMVRSGRQALRLAVE